MPRNFNHVHTEVDTTWEIENLTYENRYEQLRSNPNSEYENPTRIMLCVMGGVHTGPVNSWGPNRDAIAEKLQETYGAYTKEDDPAKRVYCPEDTNHVYMELEPPESLAAFVPFEQFLEDHIGLWKYMGVVYFYSMLARANALIYQRTTDEPVHPASPVFGMDDYDDVSKREAYANWKAYHRQKDDDNIEYEYGPQYVVNGDVEMNGLDTRLFVLENCKLAGGYPLDIRFKAHPDIEPYWTYPEAPPLEGDSRPLMDAKDPSYTIEECKRVTNYPDHLEYQEIQEEYRSVDIIEGAKEYREFIP